MGKKEEREVERKKEGARVKTIFLLSERGRKALEAVNKNIM